MCNCYGKCLHTKLDNKIAIRLVSSLLTYCRQNVFFFLKFCIFKKSAPSQLIGNVQELQVRNEFWYLVQVFWLFNLMCFVHLAGPSPLIRKAINLTRLSLEVSFQLKNPKMQLLVLLYAC